MPNERSVRQIEAKWQEMWEKEGIYRAKDQNPKSEIQNPKYYGLIEFPYPSGEGLHVGHPRSYTAMDIVTRKRRMQGYNVLFPIGWDAFGLPTENYAIKHKVKPQDATKKNIATFTRQLKSIGFGFDWSREIDTTDPAYVKWTQWQFLQFLKHGLAYKAKTMINWCPKDKIGLANEEVINGCCERCGTPVEKREKAQWMMAITKYAERLIEDLETVDYSERIKTQQINWIGKSQGATVKFQIQNPKSKIQVFTTRPDTLFGATYLVLAPEHELIANGKLQISNIKEVKEYVEQAKKKTEIERSAEDKEKTGVELKGVTAVNPATGQEIPVWIADYVLAGYGTGAIMAVPAHDERDFSFAKKHGLPIKQVVAPVFVDQTNPPRDDKKTVVRRTVQCLVRDPKRDAFLCLRWKKFDWQTFIIGGVEEGEDPLAAAVREVKEETGYNARPIRILGDQVIAKYFANHKNENRTAIVSGVLLELENNEQEPVAPEEAAKHEAVWVPADKVMDFVRGAELKELWSRLDKNETPVFTGEGENINSDFLDGLPTAEAKKKIGQATTTYRLRDWVFSRQRYWGEPIPVIICPKCGYVPVPEKDLPVLLPEVEAYEPTDTGESPLAKIRDWVEVKCPKCGGPAERETDTMPNWAGSSWYFLRYCDPRNDKALAGADKLKYWMPVDLYSGGMEHTTLHLLYSRFWYKFLWDIGAVPKACGPEPYKARRSQGLVLAQGGEKMSKSKGNVVNPDEIVERYGADVFRLYVMFMGPFEQAVPWDTNGIEGVRRFLDKVWGLVATTNPKSKIQNPKIETIYHQTVKKITEGIDSLQFNTCVSQLMILTNAFNSPPAGGGVGGGGSGGVPEDMREGYLQILAPFAPHLAEELWHQLGHKESIHLSAWPEYDATKLQAATFELVVQVNGKVRERLTVKADVTEEEAEETALASANVQKWLDGKKPQKIVYIKGRLLSIVV